MRLMATAIRPTRDAERLSSCENRPHRRPKSLASVPRQPSKTLRLKSQTGNKATIPTWSQQETHRQEQAADDASHHHRPHCNQPS